MSYFPPYLIEHYMLPNFTIVNAGESAAPQWTQKTIYLEPPSNHAMHIAKAEEKRARKSAKRKRAATKGQQHDRA